MLFHMVQEIRIRTTNAAAFVHFKVCGIAAGLKADFSREVDIPCGKGAGIDEPVDGSFTDDKGILVAFEDMVRRLSLLYKRRNDFVNRVEFVLGQ